MRWYLTTTSLHFQFIVSIRLPFIRAILILDLLQVWVVSVQLQLPYNDRIEEKRSKLEEEASLTVIYYPHSKEILIIV